MQLKTEARRWLNKNLIIEQIKTDIRANNRRWLIWCVCVGLFVWGLYSRCKMAWLVRILENNLFHSDAQCCISPGRTKLRHGGRPPSRCHALYMKSNGGTWWPSPTDKGQTEVEELALSAAWRFILSKVPSYCMVKADSALCLTWETQGTCVLLICLYLIEMSSCRSYISKTVTRRGNTIA